MSLPAASRIDTRLLVGAALFGVGWGIAGFCPGPERVTPGMGEVKAPVFVGAMLVGMAAFRIFDRRG